MGNQETFLLRRSSRALERVAWGCVESPSLGVFKGRLDVVLGDTGSRGLDQMNLMIL